MILLDNVKSPFLSAALGVLTGKKITDTTTCQRHCKG